MKTRIDVENFVIQDYFKTVRFQLSCIKGKSMVRVDIFRVGYFIGDQVTYRRLNTMHIIEVLNKGDVVAQIIVDDDSDWLQEPLEVMVSNIQYRMKEAEQDAVQQ